MGKHEHDRNGLKRYRGRRDFSRSPEPTGDVGNTSGNPIFVIQKHDASNLHYDFRLEVGGVLKSWAVPKGPSTDPREKRLAIATEDRPLDYAEFEGVVPKGAYAMLTRIAISLSRLRPRATRGREQSFPNYSPHSSGPLKSWSGQMGKWAYVQRSRSRS